jgi:hypothetical protein
MHFNKHVTKMSPFWHTEGKEQARCTESTPPFIALIVRAKNHMLWGKLNNESKRLKICRLILNN